MRDVLEIIVSELTVPRILERKQRERERASTMRHWNILVVPRQRATGSANRAEPRVRPGDTPGQGA